MSLYGSKEDYVHHHIVHTFNRERKSNNNQLQK